MNRQELQQLIRGTIATLPTAFDEGMQVDHAKMAELTRWWVSEGLGTSTSALKVAAAMGEGPDLNDEEWPHLLRTVVNAAGSDATVICALKPKNTLHTIADAKRAQDLGAVGLQIDLPFFHHANRDDLVRFFTDVSDAIDIGIMIYNTHWFTSDPTAEAMTAETMLRLADAEHVVAIKWAVPNPDDYDSMKEFAQIFNVIDNSGQPVRSHKNGGRGYISNLVAVHPAHDLGIWKLLEAGRYDEAQAEIDRVRGPMAAWMAKTAARSGGYRQLKGLMAAVGHPAGPPRPPTLPVDDAELAEITDVLKGIGWPTAA